jgi:hypothetical protein
VELPGGRLEPGEELRAAVEAGALLDAWSYEPVGRTPRSS